MPRVSFTNKPPALVFWHKQSGLLIGTTQDGFLCRIGFFKPSLLKEWQRRWPKTKFVKTSTATKIFSNKIKVLLTGTPFQQKVWKELLKIPSEKTATYADIARRIKKPSAVRAVGNALGANPVPILIPCHRVIASDGSLGGYSGGLAIKKKLLAKEGIKIK